MKILPICLAVTLFLFTTSSFAGEVSREEKPPFLKAVDYAVDYTKVTLDCAEKMLSYVEKTLNCVETLTRPVKRELRKNNIDLNFFAGILQGYDTNVNLDPDRKKDTFSQFSLNTEFIYNYTDDIRIKAENNTTDVIYYTVTSASLLDIDNNATVELDVMDDMFTLGMGCGLDFVIFPNDKDGTYLGNEVRAFVKYNAAPDVYHKMGYTFLYKGFLHDKTLGSNGTRTDDLRKDFRNSVDYEVGTYLLDRAILKANLEFYRNDSNYQHYDYYDYYSFKVRPSFIFMFTKKLYTSGSFTYQQRLYDDRLSSEDSEHVYDDTYGFSASLLYDFTKSFTVALNLSYRENSSNEPLQKYSGAVMTGGVYYSF